MSIDLFTADALAGVPHGFLGRGGGVSEGSYASLNTGIGSQDDAIRVAGNRRHALAAVAPGARLVGLHQVHGAECVTVIAPFEEEYRPRADAVVTDTPGIALGILTADCAPVLFADVEAGIVGAAHAGWKGALAGVTDTTIVAMEGLGARRDRIVAAVGPCIAQASYEVDDAFRRRFLGADAANERFFREAAPGHARFDLEGYVARRLADAGLRRIALLGLDTYADEARFFSHRRAAHRREGDAGRQIAIIARP